MITWVYDIECYKNFFCITFIPLNVNIRLVTAYKHADLAHNEADKKALLHAMKAKQFTIYNGISSVNESSLIVDFFSSYKVLYGYNSSNYDATMLDIFLANIKYFYEWTGLNKHKQHICEFMFKHSDACVSYGNGYWRMLDFLKYYKRPFTDYDIQKILYLDKSFTGLKQVAICLKWYRIQQLPYGVYEQIQDNQVFNVLDYNVNDVLITLTLILDQQAELNLRVELNKEFGGDGTTGRIVDFRNMSRSSIGKALAIKYYSQISGLDYFAFKDLRTLRYTIPLKDIIRSDVKFQTIKFQDLLVDIKASKIYITSDADKSKWERNILLNGTKYIIAKGGLHSKDDPFIYNANEDIIRDADVASYYPSLIINDGVYPKHLDRTAFLVMVEHVTRSRIKAKKTNKIKADGLKIAINRMYGALKDINDFLYDPECTYTVTFNGQLRLLMLIEDLEIHGIHCISANTDGIVCKFKHEQESIYNDCCERWQKATNLVLEFTDYERYLRNDVNNYIAIKKGFTKCVNEFKLNNKVIYHEKELVSIEAIEDVFVKRKGLFIPKVEFNKGFIHPVVPQALNAYLMYNIPIERFIEDHITTTDTAIYDYCMAQKVDKSFKCEFHTVVNKEKHIESLQQYNRFYVTDRSKGGMIMKNKGDKLTSILANHNVNIFNNYLHAEPKEYGINYGYYIKQCDLILSGNIKKKGKPKGIIGNSNNLFTSSNTDY